MNFAISNSSTQFMLALCWDTAAMRNKNTEIRKCENEEKFIIHLAVAGAEAEAEATENKIENANTTNARADGKFCGV